MTSSDDAWGTLRSSEMLTAAPWDMRICLPTKRENGDTVIGYDSDVEIVLRKCDGRVYWREPPTSETGSAFFLRLANTSLARFCQCFLLADAYVKEGLQNESEEYALEVVQAYQNRFREADAAALDDEDSVWSIVLWQMEEGNL